MQLESLFIVLGLFGLINAGNIVYKRLTKREMGCPLDHPCETVLESKWSKIFFIRNDVLGVLYYLTLLIGIIFVIVTSSFMYYEYLAYLTFAGLIFSVYLTYLQFFKINNFCTYCILSAVITFLMFSVDLLLYFNLY